ncbi:Subunit of the glycosylphosphatidylinositol transamidase complex-like protein [Microbotryomycetes sp. JL201]|nr:Subunit of the glycosylphosphatidylinositol transamidase complex-like protein [Microbotryomycetes sp. JL201]
MSNAATNGPSAQEVHRKLGSPNVALAPLATSNLTVAADNQMQRRGSSVSRRVHPAISTSSASGMSSASEDDTPSSPNRPNVPLTAISEQESGSDSDASSTAAATLGPHESQTGHFTSASATQNHSGHVSINRAMERLRVQQDNARLSDNVAVKSGYLMKKGEKRKTWKKRWFVLRGGQLAMYKNDKEYRLLRLIPLQEIHSVGPVEIKKHSHAFGIVTPKRTYYIKAESDAAVQAWCRSIEQAKQDLLTTSTTRSSNDTPTRRPSLEKSQTTPQPTAPPTPGLVSPNGTVGPAAIPIPGSSGLNVPGMAAFAPATPPTSYSQTSTSGLSSSYASTSSAGAATGPPTSGALGLQDSSGAPVQLDPLEGSSLFDRQRRPSTQSAMTAPRSPSLTLSLPPNAGSAGYFSRTRQGSLQIPQSPGGGVSSSEDEDGFDRYVSPPGPNAVQGLQFVENSLQQKQAQPLPQSQQVQQPAAPLQQSAPISPGPVDGGFGDPNKVILAGYLMKQGKRKNWRKRWFVLMGGRLMYSKSHMDTKIHRQIPITRILDAIEYEGGGGGGGGTGVGTGARRQSTLSEPMSPGSSSSMPLSSPANLISQADRNYENCFKIITPKRTYLVCAPTEEDEIKWLAALQCLVARKSGKLQPVGSTTSAVSPGTIGGGQSGAGATSDVAVAQSQAAAHAPGPDKMPVATMSTTTTQLHSPLALNEVNSGMSSSSSGPPPTGLRRPSQHGRQRSVTDAARTAIREAVEKRFNGGTDAHVETGLDELQRLEADNVVSRVPEQAHAGRNRPKQPIDSYDEHLEVEPLLDGKVLSTFTFRMNGPTRPLQQASNVHVQKTKYVSSTLVSLVELYGVKQVELSLSSGRWNLDRWGTREKSRRSGLASHGGDGQTLAFEVPASGIEVVAWLDKRSKRNETAQLTQNDDTSARTSADEVDKRFIELTNSLSGLFCAGVSNGVEQSVSTPSWVTRYEAHGRASENKMFHMSLPRLQATCTESLTPFLSLLPCASHAGLGSLLNPHKLFDGEWTLLKIKMIKSSVDKLEVQLQVGSVVDPVRQSRLQGHLGSRGTLSPTLIAPTGTDSHRFLGTDFSFTSLFDRQLSAACPVANSSRVDLLVPSHSKEPFRIEPKDGMVPSRHGDVDVASWDLTSMSIPLMRDLLLICMAHSASSEQALDVSVAWPGENQYRYPPQDRYEVPPLSVRRLLFAGYGQERGRIGVEICNNQDVDVQVVWVETWPWWLRAFIGSLQIVSMDDSAASVLDLSYTPPIARARPTTLQVLLSIPARSKQQLLVDYESSFLWYTEYPSDAHRGFEVPGAIVTLLSSSTSNTSMPVALRLRQGKIDSQLKLRTTSALIDLPTPDFSMPYNVIILTSTVIALFFGSVVNTLVRKWYVVSFEPDDNETDDQRKAQ